MIGLAARGRIGLGLARQRGGAAVPWWLSGGLAAADCAAAYLAKGVASLATSYVNLANPGTYNLSVYSTAPSLVATGWQVSAADRTALVATGLTTAVALTVLIRYTNVASNGVLIAEDSYGALDIWPKFNTTRRYRRGGESTISTTPSSGIIGFAGNDAIYNGSKLATIPAGTVPSGNLLLCGKPYAGGSPDGTIVQCAVAYRRILSEAEYSAVSTAMAAL